MSIDEFLKNFADQFDETDASLIKPDTRFRDIDEWSSLNALAVLNMIGKKYKVIITADELRRINTIKELYDLVISKKSVK
ncbi:MAG TPA: phosphopantetheine-binding protein [Candidatus Cloacimonadota bacterium]|nr:phosphopantetheine-binding protein [Candidatus Cloacimonadota bacterium]